MEHLQTNKLRDLKKILRNIYQPPRLPRTQQNKKQEQLQMICLDGMFCSSLSNRVMTLVYSFDKHKVLVSLVSKRQIQFCLFQSKMTNIGKRRELCVCLDHFLVLPACPGWPRDGGIDDLILLSQTTCTITRLKH